MSRSPPRPYRKGARARREEATRKRITEAAVELHGSVGPVQTTVTDIAKLAGVSRVTVYNHFPTELDLFVACSTHWGDRNPPPDVSVWALIEDPAARLREALRTLYGWYGRRRGMLENVIRDAGIKPVVAEVLDAFWAPYIEGVLAVLSEGWTLAEEDFVGSADLGAEDLAAMLTLAVDFHTWRVLSERGLGDEQSAEVAAAMVIGGIGVRAEAGSPYER